MADTPDGQPRQPYVRHTFESIVRNTAGRAGHVPLLVMLLLVVSHPGEILSNDDDWADIVSVKWREQMSGPTDIRAV